MDVHKEDQPSDDEIYFGNLSLKEIKHRFNDSQKHRRTIAGNELSKEDEKNSSLKLLSTQSEPDIMSGQDYSNVEGDTKALSLVTFLPDTSNSEDSFLKFEKAIEELDDSSNKECLDNTLEAIERILNSAPEKNPKETSPFFHKIVQRNLEKDGFKEEPLSCSKEPILAVSSNIKPEICLDSESSSVTTPIKKEQIKEVFATPSSVLISKKPIFKTPNPPLINKPSTSSLKKTPSKRNAFEHIASPVAYYIKNSPQIPLIQNVIPKKPLFGTSNIPKLIKSTSMKPSNKENINLPSVAYKSAKKSTVVDVPSSRPKMPESEWARKLTTSLPRPAVIKHTSREKEFTNKLLQNIQDKQDDSFGDLSLHQADLSVYTKKVAF